jgi:hypothetical protein
MYDDAVAVALVVTRVCHLADEHAHPGQRTDQNIRLALDND